MTHSLTLSPNSKTRTSGSAIFDLVGYLETVSKKPFVWGQHDCLTFTNAAWKEMHGRGWADDWLGRYLIGGRPMSREQLQQEFGFQTFTRAVDSRLRRASGIPPRGSLITTKRARRWAIGSALGISLGLKGAFLGKDGIIHLPIEQFDKAWVNP